VIKGLTPKIDFSQIQASSLELAGDLRVSGASGFIPANSLFTLMTYINQPTGTFGKITLSAPFDSWETNTLVDRFNLSTPALRTYIPLLNRQP
jgi:hypothetical protein